MQFELVANPSKSTLKAGSLNILYIRCVLAVLDSHPILSAFQVMLFEHIIMCRLITGNKTAAIQEVHSDGHLPVF